MGDGYAELYRVSQAVLSVTRQMSVRDVLQVIVRSARSLVGARYTALGVPDEGNSFAEFVVDGISQTEQQAIGPLPRRHGMLLALMTEGKPIRLNDISDDPRFGGWWPTAHPQMTHFLGVPVRGGGQVLGIIFAANKVTAKSTGFSARDEEILTLFASHAAIALTNARLYERSRELSVLEERARLARELHDAVSQKLFSIRAHARAAAVHAARESCEGVVREIEAVAALGAEAHAELRAVIDGLAPPDLTAGGLAESLRRYAEMAGRAHGVPVIFSASGYELPSQGPRTDAAIYRVAQEALHNALRHSGAGEVRVSLRKIGAKMVLEVADDGRGFATEAPSAGLGLASMRERAAAVGGSLVIRSGTPGQKGGTPGRKGGTRAGAGAGTKVRMSVPLDGGPR
jgi:signal transduction histidine kinase